MYNINLQIRFWSKVDKSPGHGPDGDCWVWTAASTKEGYGRFGFRRKWCCATHVAWYLHYGVFPQFLMLHKCDNPFCVRWSHLFEGNKKVNARDRKLKGRNADFRGERNPNCKLTDRQVQRIRNIWHRALIKTGLQVRLSAQFGVRSWAIHHIVHGHHRVPE